MRKLFPSWYPVVKLNESAIDGLIIGLEGESLHLISDFALKTSIPLVVNMGSYNWGLFMAKLDDQKEIYNAYCVGENPTARFLTIYIEEASDGKGVNDAKPVEDYHRSIEDRIKAAKRLISEKEFPGEVVCDSMKNELLTRYDAHPERILIIDQGKVVHIGGAAGSIIYYDLDSISEWLRLRKEGNGNSVQPSDNIVVEGNGVAAIAGGNVKKDQ